MRKVILLSSVLLAAPFMLGEIGEASAQCTTTPSCSSMGYTSGVNTGNCLKCPTGNYYFCPPKNSSCTSNCSGYTLTYSQAQSLCGSGSSSCHDQCSGQLLYKCISSSSGSCSGYGLTEAEARNKCMSIGMGIESCRNEMSGILYYKCIESGGSSSGGSSGGTTPTVCKIRTFAKYENCKWQAISDLSGNIMCQRCTYKEQRQSKNSTQWNQISRQCNSNFEKENFISVTDKEALNSYVQTVLQKDEGSEISGSSSCIEYY